MDLFRESENYNHFLGLMDKHVQSVAEIFAWVLMRIQFHLWVRIKENIGYKYSLADRDPENDSWLDEHNWKTIDLSSCEEDLSTSEAVDSVSKANECFKLPETIKIPNPTLHFSHLLNAYCKYFNRCNTRHGGLFECCFERKHIDNERYLKRMVLYIHNYPVHHGFCDHPVEYPWSSYLTCISIKPTELKREAVLGWFDSEANFKQLHNEKDELEQFDKWIDLKN